MSGKALKHHIVTFGCAQNVADSERIASYLLAKGMNEATNINEADYVVINTCMVREMAENRVYGLVNNLTKNNPSISLRVKEPGIKNQKIILTGCMVGMAVRDKTGKFLKLLKKKMPMVDEFLPIEEIGFDYSPLRTDKLHALVPISNGCNNFCTYCVVPWTRGREASRPYRDIIEECKDLAKRGYKKITLLGQNVNSYGADLVKSKIQIKDQKLKKIKPIYVKHLGRYRIPTLFPHLLEDICHIEGIEEIEFMSSNPWDFSDELIQVIVKNHQITRNIHLPVQSGSNSVLERMNRWYTCNEYLKLVANLKLKIKNLKLSTDIIVGFCGETKEEFEETVNLVKKVGFYKAYIAMYSDRPMTAAHKVLKDNIPHLEKKRRWRILEELINKPKKTTSYE
jgi:tRNA-2-methylthio-N6-dimethylallyladenosine synthase